MLLFVFKLDEEKIKREKRYNLKGMYYCIDDAYQQVGGRLLEEEDGVRVYTRDEGDGDDYQNLWRVALGLRKKEWFMDNLEMWRFIITDKNNKIKHSEDLTVDVKIL